MTNNQIAALVAAAKFTAEVGGDEMVVDPSAILSLVARLREADELIWAAFAHTRRPTSAEAEWRDRARAYMEKHT